MPTKEQSNNNVSTKQRYLLKSVLYPFSKLGDTHTRQAAQAVTEINGGRGVTSCCKLGKSGWRWVKTCFEGRFCVLAPMCWLVHGAVVTLEIA